MSASNTTMWRIGGWDTFSGEAYSISGEYATEQEAQEAARALLAEIACTQPEQETGGPDGGVQDRVFVVCPDGSEYRFCG